MYMEGLELVGLLQAMAADSEFPASQPPTPATSADSALSDSAEGEFDRQLSVEDLIGPASPTLTLAPIEDDYKWYDPSFEVFEVKSECTAETEAQGAEIALPIAPPPAQAPTPPPAQAPASPAWPPRRAQKAAAKPRDPAQRRRSRQAAVARVRQCEARVAFLGAENERLRRAIKDVHQALSCLVEQVLQVLQLAAAHAAA